MKTTVEMLIDVLEIFNNLQISNEEKQNWIMKSKLELQDAYNAGFEFAHKKKDERNGVEL